jgi:hypothetical protein
MSRACQARQIVLEARSFFALCRIGCCGVVKNVRGSAEFYDDGLRFCGL